MFKIVCDTNNQGNVLDIKLPIISSSSNKLLILELDPSCCIPNMLILKFIITNYLKKE